MFGRLVYRRIPLLFLREQSWVSCNNKAYSTVQATEINVSRYSKIPSSNSLLIRRGPKFTSVRHSSSKVDPNNRQLVYQGPLSRSVQLVKVFSLSTALATMVVTPMLMIYGKQTVPMAGKLAIGLTIVLAGTSTTFLLHWVTKVYVHRMFYNAATERFTVETMSLFARRKETEFTLDEVRLAKEPTAFTTFQAKGNKYFLHTDLIEAQQVLQFIRENRSM